MALMLSMRRLAELPVLKVTDVTPESNPVQEVGRVVDQITNHRIPVSQGHTRWCG
jgi:hypothetical protein